MRTEGFKLEVEGCALKGTLCLPTNRGRNTVFAILHGLPFSPQPVEEKGYLDFASLFTGKGVSVALPNLRGTGGSGGYFSLGAWAKDAEALLEYLSEKFKGYTRYLLGFSAGGIVAIYVASQNPEVGGVVSCSAPYQPLRQDRARSMLERALYSRVIKGDGSPDYIDRITLEAERYAPSRWAQLIAPRPTLIVHGRLDEIVPLEEAYRLYEAAGEPKRMLVLETGHRVRASISESSSMVAAALNLFRLQ